MAIPESLKIGVDMPKPAIDASSLIRIGTYTAELERLHLWGTDEEIDREFKSVCRTIWGYALDDFDDDCISKEDHGWLDVAPDPYPVALRVWRLPSCTVRAMCQGAEPLASAAPWPDCGEKFAA